MKKTITPRPLPIVIAAVLAAVAMPGAFGLVMLTANGFRVEGTPASDLWKVIAFLGGSGVIIGWPITLFLRKLGRHSVLANAAGVLAFVAIASVYPTVTVPGHRDLDSKVHLFAAHMLIFTIYCTVTVSIAFLIGRLSRPGTQLGLD